MRTIIRTMLAAAAGAALVASGTTVVRLSDPAFAEEQPAVEVAPRAEPLVTAPPAAFLDVMPEPEPVAAAPAVEPTTAPDPAPQRRVRQAVVDEPATQEPEPAPVEPPTVEPAATVAAEPTTTPRADDSSDRRDDMPTAADDNTDDEDRDYDRPSLLGRLTEPLGVTCGGLLRRICS